MIPQMSPAIEQKKAPTREAIASALVVRGCG
jgi:hypothetical protein